MKSEEYFKTQSGWKCPVCMTVHAPWVMKCGECKKESGSKENNTDNKKLMGKWIGD